MISKVRIGKNFRGVCRYVLNKEGAEMLYSNGVRSDRLSNTIQDFELLRRQRPQLKSAVVHISISFAYEDNEKLSNSKLIELSQAFLTKMKFSNNQSITVKHTDTKHIHFHTIANRVGYDGGVYSDSYIKNRAARACDELEQEFGLTVARGHGMGRVISDKVPIKSRYKIEIKEALMEGLANGIKDFDSLKAHLASRQIEMRLQIQSTGRVNGISFSKDSIAFKGSSIDKSLSFTHLKNKLILNQEIIKGKQNAKDEEYER